MNLSHDASYCSTGSFNIKQYNQNGSLRQIRERYVACYAKRGGMSQGFAYYRAAALSASQNAGFGQHELQMPVLALGGSSGMGDKLKTMMEVLAVNVEGSAIEDCGHYVMEEQPEVLADRLLAFFKDVEKG